jgi:hypothetical protein
MAACGVLVLVGLVLVVRWGGTGFEAPGAGSDTEGPPSPGLVARRYVWHVTVAVVAGLGSGVLLAGAGGRLAMRLLAATAGDAAQGRVTEADEVVGEISLGGTIGFVVFTGLFFGLATGGLYLLLRRWLPPGRLGGAAYGGLLLVLAATRLDPLRAENPDFAIVGPGWLAVVVFAALVVTHGMLVAAVAGRYSRVLPLISRRAPALVAHAPLLLLGPMAPVLVPLAAVGALTVILARAEPLAQGLRSRSVTIAGRVVLAAVALAALPGFVSSVADILGRQL